MRLVIELKRGENVDVVLNQLFKHSPMQTSFSIQQIALVDGRPRTLNLRDLLLSYKDHRFQVIRRRSRHLLEKAEYKAHILAGYLIALDNIDRIIAIIRSSHTVDDARGAMMLEFGLTRIQADAILQMRLSRLTGLERIKIEEDLAKTQEEIQYHREVLTKDALVVEIIREDIHELVRKFPSPRRSEIIDAVEDIDIGDLIAEDTVVVTLSHQGYVKRTPVSTYRSQGRGGQGVSGGKAREGDFIKSLYIAGTHDTILFFTDRGKVYWLKVYDIPDMARTALGRAIVNLLPLEPDERVLSSIQVKEFDERMVVFATRNGVVKKTALSAYSRPKKTGIIAIKIEEGDELIGVALTRGQDEVILSTAHGMAIRFAETDVREMGRASRGVRGIALSEGDQVVRMTVVREGGSLLTICQNGFGKRTLFEEYRPQRRGGKGLIDIRTTDRNGPVVTALAIVGDPDVMFMTSGGMLVRIAMRGVRDIGRNTQGVRLIRVKEGDKLVGAELVEDDGEERPEGEPVEDAPIGDDEPA
jgi:DNA gyrase subunit A